MKTKLKVVHFPAYLINPATGLKEEFDLQVPFISDFNSGTTKIVRVALQDKFKHLRNFIPKNTTFRDDFKNGFTQIPINGENVKISEVEVNLPDRDFSGINHPILACFARGDFERNPLQPLHVEPIKTKATQVSKVQKAKLTGKRKYTRKPAIVEGVAGSQVASPTITQIAEVPNA